MHGAAGGHQFAPVSSRVDLVGVDEVQNELKCLLVRVLVELHSQMPLFVLGITILDGFDKLVPEPLAAGGDNGGVRRNSRPVSHDKVHVVQLFRTQQLFVVVFQCALRKGGQLKSEHLPGSVPRSEVVVVQAAAEDVHSVPNYCRRVE